MPQRRKEKNSRRMAAAAFVMVFTGLAIEKFASSRVNLNGLFEVFETALIIAFITYMLAKVLDFP